jgi:hypothetical protein
MFFQHKEVLLFTVFRRHLLFEIAPQHPKKATKIATDPPTIKIIADVWN